MTNPREVLKEAPDKTLLERFKDWLSDFEGVTENTDHELVGLFRGSTAVTKGKAHEDAVLAERKEVVHKIDALIAVDIRNTSVIARNALADEIERSKAQVSGA